MIHNELDHDDADPETVKEWKRQYRKKCWLEMRAYLKDFPDATSEERQALREWVKSSHSPYDNGDYVATESGGPMDFIHARRFLEEEYLEYLKDSEGYHGSPDTGKQVPDRSDSNNDLPF